MPEEGVIPVVTLTRQVPGSGSSAPEPGEPWALGVDLGGTKVLVAAVSAGGEVGRRVRCPTEVEAGAEAIQEEITRAARTLLDEAATSPVGLGAAVAGQIEAGTGVVSFSPNLDWRDVPLQEGLSRALALPAVVVNDVRAAAWGEWLHGAGRGTDDLICMFVGTGVGGGIVSGGRMVEGCANTAGEIGHLTVLMDGPECHCRNRGCLEALAGGWAIARDAQAAVASGAEESRLLLELAGGDRHQITARTVVEAFRKGDPLAGRLIERVIEALAAGIVGLVNAFNPCRIIMGGGVVEGLPELVERVRPKVEERALRAATVGLEIVPAQLHGDAGVVGGAALALRMFGEHGLNRSDVEVGDAEGGTV